MICQTLFSYDKIWIGLFDEGIYEYFIRYFVLLYILWMPTFKPARRFSAFPLTAYLS